MGTLFPTPTSENPVGHISFDSPSKVAALQCYELGFTICPEYRRKGYAAMAGRLLVDKLFNATQIQRIQSHCRVENKGSSKTMEAIGMKPEGVLRQLAWIGGAFEDVLLCSILRSEWGDSNAYAERFGGL